MEHNSEFQPIGYDTPDWPKNSDGTPLSIDECFCALYSLFLKGMATVMKDENGDLAFGITQKGRAALLIETAMMNIEMPYYRDLEDEDENW